MLASRVCVAETVSAVVAQTLSSTIGRPSVERRWIVSESAHGMQTEYSKLWFCHRALIALTKMYTKM